MIAEQNERHDNNWRFALLGLCILAFAISIAGAVDSLGPWYGFWDANADTSSRPYTIAIAQPRPGGASAQAGLRDGDLIDLREQPLSARIAVVYQPFATRTSVLKVRRGAATLDIAVQPSTGWVGAAAWKLPAQLMPPLMSFWFAACALLIALRRRTDWNARILALVLLCIVGTLLQPNRIVVPNDAMRITFAVLASVCSAVAALLLVLLASRFGTQSALRRVLETVAYVAIGLDLAADLATAIGLITLWWDPIPFIVRISLGRGILDVGTWLLVSLCAIAAIYQIPNAQRAKAAWLLLPLPIALLTSAVVTTFLVVIKSWYGNLAVVLLSGVIGLLSAVIVTYALLKRRVLDFEFVLSRTLVVATVSLIVVASFVLLEWILGTVLAGVSHATGLIANAGLALALGLSLNAIHRRVDALVEEVLFRKRREDERALLDFSKEAYYVTDADALLDRTIEKVRRHTDALSATILLDGTRTYSAMRSFGEVSPQISENDGAILALKTWHKPIDPHHYQTALRGALALPMLARGKLFGVLVLGERAGGEAYAPDEVEALSQFAQGVGASLDALSTKDDGLVASLERSIATMSESLAALAKETATLRNDLRKQTQ